MKTKNVKIEKHSIAVPLGTFPDGVHIPGHVELQLNDRQGRALKSLFVGLDESGDRLENRNRVRSNADAIRLVLERIADGLPD